MKVWVKAAVIRVGGFGFLGGGVHGLVVVFLRVVTASFWSVRV